MREDVSRALQEFKIKTFGNKKTLEKSESLLSDDETVLFVTPTNISTIILSTQQQMQKCFHLLYPINSMPLQKYWKHSILLVTKF